MKPAGRFNAILDDWLDKATSEIVVKREKAFRETAYPEGVMAMAIEGRYHVRSTDGIDGDAEGDEMSAGPEVALDRHLDDVRREVAALNHLVSEPLARALDSSMMR